MELSDNLLCLFTAGVQEKDGSYVIEVPKREVAMGDIETESIYRIAMLSQTSQEASTEKSGQPSGPSHGASGPPVQEGELLDVEIEDVGDQGDGIARVGPGYVIIVPETEMGERVSVEISEVRENMAFANVVDRYDSMQ